MDLPVNVSTGLVVGRYIADVIDGQDANLEPDALPVRGQIVFTASVPYLPNPTATPDPVTIMRVPIVGVLDSDGYLCTPYPGTKEPQYRGVRLIATDDPDISVEGWTWDVTYFFDAIDGHKLAIPAHGFALPSDSTVDLTKVAKVPSSPGYSLPQAEAAVLRAEEAALTSAQDAAAALDAALRAEQAAAATDQGITDMLSDPGTQSGGLLVDLLDPKANTEDVNIALMGKADRQATESALADKADSTAVSDALALKADLSGGKVPVSQLPADALVTDANVSAQINGAQTGPAIDQRVNDVMTPVVEQIAADYIASDPAVVDAAAAAVNANPKIAGLEAAQWRRGLLPNGTNYQTGLNQSGWWWITTFANAQTMVPPLPDPGAGTLTRREVGNSVTLIWEPIMPDAPGDIWKMERLGPTFTGWERVGSRPRRVPLNSNLDDFRTSFHEGAWNCPTNNDALTVANRPWDAQFRLEVKHNNGSTWQFAYPGGTGATKQIMARKYSLFAPGIGWSAWEPYGNGSATSSSGQVSQRRKMLEQRNRVGHGGQIGVGTAVPVGISFDHGFDKYQSVLYPHLKRLGIPHSLAVNTNGLGAGENASVSYPELQNFALNHGAVLMNHARSHDDATTDSAIEDAILGSLNLLKTNCPKTVVDSFIMPGVSGTKYNGFNSGEDDYSKWWTHVAGRVILDNHAVVTSTLPGNAISSDGDQTLSMGRRGFDYVSQATEVQNLITALRGTGMGVQIFNHPNLIDTSGYITLARVVQLLEWLAAERDAGRVELLSATGLAWARTGSTKRHDLVAGKSWTDGQLTFQIGPLFEWARGYHRQLAVKCSIAADVTLKVLDDTGLLNATVTQSVPDGGVARLNFGIPVDSASLTFTVSSTAGTLSGHTVYAV